MNSKDKNWCEGGKKKKLTLDTSDTIKQIARWRGGVLKVAKECNYCATGEINSFE